MKKFIALFLVFSLLALSGNLIAKERRGAEIVIQKKDGQHVRGELLAVKKDSLLLLSDFWTDVSVDIKDVKVIKIVRKSKALIGLIAGGALGALLGLATYDKPVTKKDSFMANIIDFGPEYVAVGGAALGAILGVAIGAAIGTDETIQIEGKSDWGIKAALEKLRKKARIRDYK